MEIHLLGNAIWAGHGGAVMCRIIAQINYFLIRRQKTILIYFYVWIPLILRKSTISVFWVILSALISFLWYIVARYRLYSKKYGSNIRWFRDAGIMLLGCISLYSIEICVYKGTDVLNLIVYLVAFTTYIPTLLSTLDLRTI